MSSEKKLIYFDRKDYQLALCHSPSERYQRTPRFRPSASLQLMGLFFLTQFIPVAFAEDKFFFKDDQGTYYYVTSVIGKMSATIYNYLKKGQCQASLSYDVGADQYPYTLISQTCVRKTVEPQFNPERYIKIYCQSGKYPNQLFKECIETFFLKACQEHYDNEFWETLPIIIGVVILFIISIGVFVYYQSNTPPRVALANRPNPFAQDKLVNADRVAKLLEELSTLASQCNNLDQSIKGRIAVLEKEVTEFRQNNSCGFTHEIMENPVAASSGVYFDGEQLWEHIRQRGKTCPLTFKPLIETLEHFPSVNLDKKNQINEGLKNFERKVQQLKDEITALLTTKTTLPQEPTQELHRRIVKQ